MARGRGRGRGGRGGRGAPPSQNDEAEGYVQLDNGNPGPQLAPHVRAAIAAEIGRAFADAVPELMREDLRDARAEESAGRGGRGNGGRGAMMGRGGGRGLGAALDGEDEAVIVREGCTYQSFKRCDPPKLSGLGDASTVL